MNRVTRIGTFALALGAVALAGAAPAAAEHHEKVIQVVSVDVKPGMLGKYQAQVKKLSGVLEKVGSKATMRMWQNTQGGENTGTVLVVLEYPDAATWAADSPKIQGDKGWQDIISGLDQLRTVEGSALWTEITPTPGGSNAPGSGSVLVVTGVRVNPGMVDEYTKRVAAASGASERLGLTSHLRIWQATLAGTNTGNVAVGAEYKDLATYVAENAKLTGDAEWQKILAGLGEIRSLASRSLYQEITP